MSEINFLTHRPKGQVALKNPSARYIFTGQNNKLHFWVTYMFVLVNFIKVIWYEVEYTLKEEARAKFAHGYYSER